MKKMLAVMLLLYPMSAFAGTYQWTDQNGTVNFAEDLGKVPKQYRKQAKSLEDGGSGVPQITESTEKSEAVLGVAKGSRDQKAKKLYAGKEGEAWLKDFMVVNYEVQSVGTQIADLRLRLNDTSKMSRSEYLSIQSSIKNAESSLQQRQKKLDLLKESADRAGVPQEFRQ